MASFRSGGSAGRACLPDDARLFEGSKDDLAFS